MSYEVELKFPLESAEQISAQFDELQVEQEPPVEQTDRYFNHPARDFAGTDEALRIRTVGEQSRMTYKGPLVDEQTKTRREIEIPFGSTGDDAERLAELLTALGFREVRSVHKMRRVYRLTWEGRPFELALDDVTDLGLYFEIETTADDLNLDAARESALRLAERLGLQNSERRSYLQLLLEQDHTG